MPKMRSPRTLIRHDPNLHRKLVVELDLFVQALRAIHSLTSLAGPVYEILEVAIPYILEHQKTLDGEQAEFLTWACNGTECIAQDVFERNQGTGLTTHELGKSFVAPLALFLGLFAEVAADQSFSALVPFMRSALVAQATAFFDADGDLNPEVLLPFAEDLYDDIETDPLQNFVEALQRSRNTLFAVDSEFTSISLPEVADPLVRYSEADIEKFLSMNVVGYGRPSVPRFGDGPRLLRLQQRIEAIRAGQSEESDRLQLLEQVWSELNHRQQHYANLDAQAREGRIGFSPSDRHLN